MPTSVVTDVLPDAQMPEHQKTQWRSTTTVSTIWHTFCWLNKKQSVSSNKLIM